MDLFISNNTLAGREFRLHSLSHAAGMGGGGVQSVAFLFYPGVSAGRGAVERRNEGFCQSFINHVSHC